MILITAAAREDGATKLMAPADLPAVADPDVVSTLRQICIEQQASYHRGLVLTSDLFYPAMLPSSLEIYSKCGVLGVEMEASCLLTVAQLRGIKAGGIAVVDGNPLKWDEGDYDPHGTVVAQAKEKMLLIGLHLATKMAEELCVEHPNKRPRND